VLSLKAKAKNKVTAAGNNKLGREDVAEQKGFSLLRILVSSFCVALGFMLILITLPHLMHLIQIVMQQ